jgi:predicted acetyltransferase
MVAALLATIAGRGYPLSVLFPVTAPLYRAAGWEIAGGVHETVLPSAALAALLTPELPGAAAEPKFRRATPADGTAIVEVKGLVHRELRHCGPNTRDPAELRDWLDDEDHFAYLADDGFLSYRWADGMEAVAVEELIAVSAETARAFWQILASHASMAGQVRSWLPPEDAVTWLTREPAAVTTRTESWMLRIIDAPAAFAGRGYPAGVSLSAVLDLSDPVRPANSGRWTLQVGDGAGRLERTGAVGSMPGPAALSLGARGLAALYAGVPVSTLRLAGLVAGGSAAGDDALGAAFSGPAFLIDRF